ncbi:MAG: dTDP-4-dehydrorhamnose reductase [Psychroserpens sp.]|uniref:dTDP-4-dehydrorhamnose reductase n=1 Tax=Psychroserpens sp. TaxID=2020870 RepID=UPI003001C61F
MVSVLVTGANGQLARNIRDLESNNLDLKLIYRSSIDLDITDMVSVNRLFKNEKIDYCINCAAYTAVDKAESDEENALKTNVEGVKNLAKACHENGSTLIHISTDFVFDGKTYHAYKESDITNPQGIYGLTKLKGEQEVIKYLTEYYIIRTSWLYSEHNANFMKTMISLSEKREELSVVDDQIGTPTYAKDLAEVILKIINNSNKDFGVYNYSNEGVASWYDFAKAIFDESNSGIKLSPIKTKEYPTPAERPPFSVLDKTKIKGSFKIEIPHWRDSLKKAIINFNNIGN